MTQQPQNGETEIKKMSDEELETYQNHAKHLIVEFDLRVRCYKQKLAIAIEELEFHKSGNPRRTAEEWGQLWVQAVNEVAEAHELSFEDAWEIAEKVIAAP